MEMFFSLLTSGKSLTDMRFIQSTAIKFFFFKDAFFKTVSNEGLSDGSAIKPSGVSCKTADIVAGDDKIPVTAAVICAGNER